MEVRILASDEDHHVLGDDYCSGYADQHGKWNTGFYCPSKSNDEIVYCCGTQTYKYCCHMRDSRVQTHNNLRTQLDPRILLKIVGLTCIVSVFLTILTCYVCKRYWKRSDARDNHVYRVACTTSSSPHVFPLESFQPLHTNAFLKSPEHTANICGDISVISGHHPSQYRVISSRPTASAAALCSYQHSSVLRQQRSHEPPPPYHVSVISANNGVTPNCSTNNNENPEANTNPKSVEASVETEVKELHDTNSPLRNSTRIEPIKSIWRRLSQ